MYPGVSSDKIPFVVQIIENTFFLLGWPCKRNCGHAPFRDRYARNNHEHTTCSENKHPRGFQVCPFCFSFTEVK